MKAYYLLVILFMFDVASSVMPDSTLTCEEKSMSLEFKNSDISEPEWTMFFYGYENDPMCMTNKTLSNGASQILLRSSYNNCGISFKSSNDGKTVYYWGVVDLRYENTNRKISRKPYKLYYFRCTFNTSSKTATSTSIYDSYESQSRYGTSEFKPELDLYNQQFDRKYTSARIGQTMYFQITLRNQSNNAVVNALNCYSEDPEGNYRHYLIRNGCPDPNDGTVELIPNSNQQIFRWKNQAFQHKFNIIKKLRYLYIQCEISVCDINRRSFPICKRCGSRNVRNIPEEDVEQIDSIPVNIPIKSPIITLINKEGKEEKKESLKNPSKTIFKGTQGAIITGLLVFIGAMGVLFVVVKKSFRKKQVPNVTISMQNMELGLDNKAIDNS